MTSTHDERCFLSFLVQLGGFCQVLPFGARGNARSPSPRSRHNLMGALYFLMSGRGGRLLHNSAQSTIHNDFHNAICMNTAYSIVVSQASVSFNAH